MTKARTQFHSAFDDEIVHEGYTRRQLNAAFEKVQPKENWKYPIRAYLPGDTSKRDLHQINAAVVFFCGCPITVSRSQGLLLVTAPGYYAAVGM